MIAGPRKRWLGQVPAALAIAGLLGCGLQNYDPLATTDAGDDAPPLAPALARYWINEAPALQGVEALLDDAADPVNLPLIYEPGNPVFEEAPPHGRHLRFLGDADVGSLHPIAGTKFETLHQASHVTLEAKFQVDACDLETTQQRIFGFGDGHLSTGDGWLAIRAWQPDGIPRVGLALTWPGLVDWMYFYPDQCPTSVIVMHAVVDTTKQTEQDRVRIYSDGTRLPVSVYSLDEVGIWPPLDTTIDLGEQAQYAYVARATDGPRSSGERIFYLAVYDRVLTDGQIAAHAAALLARDD